LSVMAVLAGPGRTAACEPAAAASYMRMRMCMRVCC
jgi:hypothetical protein